MRLGFIADPTLTLKIVTNIYKSYVFFLLSS